MKLVFVVEDSAITGIVCMLVWPHDETYVVVIDKHVLGILKRQLAFAPTLLQCAPLDVVLVVY